MTSKKNIGISHVNHSATPKAILTKVHDRTCNLNVYIFYFRFALGIIHDDRCDRKNTKNNYCIQVNPLFSVVEISYTVTVWRNARFDVILTSVTIIKQIFLRKVSCYKSLVDIETKKTLKHLIIDTSYSPGSSDVIINVNTVTPINPLFLLRK